MTSLEVSPPALWHCHLHWLSVFKHLVASTIPRQVQLAHWRVLWEPHYSVALPLSLAAHTRKSAVPRVRWPLSLQLWWVVHGHQAMEIWARWFSPCRLPVCFAAYFKFFLASSKSANMCATSPTPCYRALWVVLAWLSFCSKFIHCWDWNHLCW